MTHVRETIEAIHKATDKAVPHTCPSDRINEGWTEGCSAVLAEAKRLKRAHNQHHTDESWEAYRVARNQKARTIKKALRDAHRERVEQAAKSPEALWKLVRWAKTRGNRAPLVTPAIRHPETQLEITDPAKKADVFLEADLEDIRDAQYDNRVVMPPMTEKEVSDAIRAASSLKAPGPDGIANKALQAGAAHLAAHLTRIFNQSLHLGYCPAHFRESTTVVLREPGKDNYTVPKSYRPIALMNTTGKIMDAVIARRLSYLAETHHVLPPTHIGGRKRRSTEHALHVVTYKIYEAWSQSTSQVASLLLLDVSGAFDNVSHVRLLHSL